MAPARPPLSLETELGNPDRAQEIIDQALYGGAVNRPDDLLLAFLALYRQVQQLPRSPDRTRALNEIRSAAMWAGQAARQG